MQQARKYIEDCIDITHTHKYYSLRNEFMTLFVGGIGSKEATRIPTTGTVFIRGTSHIIQTMAGDSGLFLHLFPKKVIHLFRKL